jgi:hypothetical protein
MSIEHKNGGNLSFWSDESTFEIFVFCEKDEEEVWWYEGCFSGNTVSDLFRIQGTLNQHGYHNFLQWYPIPSDLRLVEI